MTRALVLLRNNVMEWNRKTDGEWNWTTNRERMIAYWRKRVQANAACDSFWTIGLRGIHDGAMEGGGTTADKVRRLEDAFAVQRDLLRNGLGRDPATVPQAFIPYKEVLELYDAGLRVPDDVTLIWPDDNHGYLRHLPTAAEHRRSGGNGIYYHLSYLGAPISYFWLDSTPPARLAAELTKEREVSVFAAPDQAPRPVMTPLPAVTVIDLGTAALKPGRDGRRRWEARAGLVDGLALVQTAMNETPVTDLARVADAPSVAVTVTGRPDGKTVLRLHALPTQPPYHDRPLRVAVSVDGGRPVWAEFPAHTEYSQEWAPMVLRHRMTATVELSLKPGNHQVLVHGTEPTVILTGADVAP